MSENEAMLPGESLVREGLADLAQGRVTECSLLLLVASPRLRALGIAIAELAVERPYEHRLYERIEQRLGDGAHSYYNSLIRTIVSYSRALERERSARV